MGGNARQLGYNSEKTHMFTPDGLLCALIR